MFTAVMYFHMPKPTADKHYVWKILNIVFRLEIKNLHRASCAHSLSTVHRERPSGAGEFRKQTDCVRKHKRETNPRLEVLRLSFPALQTQPYTFSIRAHPPLRAFVRTHPIHRSQPLAKICMTKKGNKDRFPVFSLSRGTKPKPAARTYIQTTYSSIVRIGLHRISKFQVQQQWQCGCLKCERRPLLFSLHTISLFWRERAVL